MLASIWNGDHYEPKLIERGNTGGGLSTHTQSTSNAIAITGKSSSGALDTRVLDEVGIYHRSAVKGETLAQLDKGDGVGAKVDLSRHTPECPQFFLGGRVCAVEVRYLHWAGALVVRRNLDGGRSTALMLLVRADRQGRVMQDDIGSDCARHVVSEQASSIDPGWSVRERMLSRDGASKAQTTRDNNVRDQEDMRVKADKTNLAHEGYIPHPQRWEYQIETIQ